MATLELPDFVADRPAREVHRALVAADAAADRARHCAVLWFGEILRRGLYRDLGYGSMPQYAKTALGFSASKSTDFMTLSPRSWTPCRPCAPSWPPATSATPRPARW